MLVRQCELCLKQKQCKVRATVYNVLIVPDSELKVKIDSLHKTIIQLENSLIDESRPGATDTLRLKLQACLGQITTVLSEIGDSSSKESTWTDEREWLSQKKTLLELRSFGMHRCSQRCLTFQDKDDRQPGRNSGVKRRCVAQLYSHSHFLENVSLLALLTSSLMQPLTMTEGSTKSLRVLGETTPYVVYVTLINHTVQHSVWRFYTDSPKI